MRVQIVDRVSLWLSARETQAWADRPGEQWPCSTLAGKRLMASFDANGVLEIKVNGKRPYDVPADEFSAITSDHLRLKLPKDHPAYWVNVGQFYQDR